MTKRDLTHEANIIDLFVCSKLIKLRTRRGLSQTDMERLLGVSHQQYQRYESGENRLTAGRLWDICRCFDVTVGSMFNGLKQSNRGGVTRKPQRR